MGSVNCITLPSKYLSFTARKYYEDIVENDFEFVFTEYDFMKG
jgi:hypothetical protein